MKKLLCIIIGAAILEVIAMEAKLMELPETAGVILGVLAAALAFLAVIEKPKPDERDTMLAWRSSHIAFLSVSTVLIGILIYQTIAHAVDAWLIIAVAALLIGKVAGRIVAGRNN